MAKIVLVIEDKEGGTSVAIDKDQSDLDGATGEALPLTLALLESIKMAQSFTNVEPAKPEKMDGKVIPFPTDGRKDH